MSVSSVKNLNGEVFSAVQDASLTNVVQTNSGNWNEISAYELASANFITAHQDLSNYQTTAGMTAYYTTAEANTLSSMLSGAIDYVSGAVTGGGGTTGEYVPLSATNCSIGSNNTTESYGLAQGYNNIAKVNSFAQGSTCTAERYSMAQGVGNSAAYYSLVQGTNNRASNTAMAQGDTCSAYSNAIAFGTRASAGYNSICLGSYASAYTNCFGIGNYNKLESTSFAVGEANTAKWGSVALGYGNHSAVATAFCFGAYNTGNNLAAVFGKNLILNGDYNSGTMALGTNNKLSANVAFVIGNGSSYNNRSDCFVIYPDGSVSAAGKISANGVELGAGGGGGASYTGDAQGALDKVYANSGNWISTTNNDASALFYANQVTNGNQTFYGPVLSAKATNNYYTNLFEIRAGRFTIASEFNYNYVSAYFSPECISSYGNGNWTYGDWDWHLDYRGLGGTFSDNYSNKATWSALRNVDLGLTTGGVVSSISGHGLTIGDVNNIVLTASLPATPDANTLYLIPEA